HEDDSFEIDDALAEPKALESISVSDSVTTNGYYGGYGDEGIRRFDGYYGDGNKDGSTAVKEKGIVKHFGITLEEKEGKYDATAQQDEEDMARIKCYICQRMGHFDLERPSKDQRPTDGASTSRQQGEKDTHSSS
nr:hypothetical protein [Tanacetum cinerariifolium]